MFECNSKIIVATSNSQEIAGAKPSAIYTVTSTISYVVLKYM